MSVKELLLLYFCVNVFSFIVMMLDKWFAVKHKWRISEFFLLSTAVLGGSVGMVLGMVAFRHKLSKLKFRLLGVVLTVLHFALFSYVVMGLNT